ncbi:MAG: Do family serine endopeptidase [Bacteroidetes bacterium]|nr:MAG: Do family serine endopeptidase [Bacteroidota bacterium]
MFQKKDLALLVFAAMLGSLFTVGLNYAFNPKKEKVFRIEHSNQAPALISRYDAHDTPGPDFTGAAERVMPTVVHIRSTQLRPSGRGATPNLPEAFRDFFGDEFFFGPGPQRSPGQPQPAIGTGSGVIISDDGYIVTNNHVIDKADDIEVTLHDNRTFKADLVGVDPSTDLALLKIEGDDLSAVTLGNSDDVRVGQWVLAIGNPFNLNSTVTAGIVSAKARNINILRDQSAIESFIQTDAAVNPGNSGGALVDLNGNLIGINTAIASPTGSYSGYSFAVPVSIVRKVMEDLLQYGTVQRGYLGVIIRSLDATLAREHDLDITEGVYVDSLVSNSAAEAAGIEKGDVILSVDGTPVRQSSELIAAVGTRRPGDKVELQVQRDGKEKTFEVTLRNREGNTELVAEAELSVLNELGVDLAALDRDELKVLGLDHGVKITQLRPGKLSRETDVREGFIITHIDGEKIKSPEDVQKVLADKKGGVMMEGRYENYPRTFYYAFGM